MDKDKARSEIEKLVIKYNKTVEENRVKDYNEEMTKKDFIRPLFHALGWDTLDSREVSAEEKVSKGRVDYSFRINGIPKFFLEAKPLKANLDNEKYFEQAISYAWHKGCTWAVLTDFEEIKVLNAEVKAANYMQSRFFAITCNDFLNRFDELWLLSKESFEKGLLDKRAEKWGKKTKKASIDEQLLEDFTRYRRMLTKSIIKLNTKEKLSEEELDESVQRILDRLIFIRNCEDRELEEKLLISKLREWESKGRGKFENSLREIFRYFDEQYNSKIFSVHLCDRLEIENEVLSEIIKGLYHIKEKYFSISYDFSVIDADVLGNIYEQYLSNILKKTAKRAKVAKNGQHRKEQGIYYTPTYVVDYIVRNTLGKILENKKIDPEKIKILDPACGSGSFLIKAFDVFDEYYKKDIKDYGQTQLDKQRIDIPFTKKAKILKDNVFGVDLDKQAVQIAQLNLLLKIAEKGHKLPLLEKNIKCGNSLINDEKVAGDRAFKWKEEFNDIINQGGFDVIIGNPPYVRPHKLKRIDKEFFWENYNTFKAKSDLYNVFMEKGINLLKEQGLFSFIVPHTWISLESFFEIRKYILNKCKILKLVQLPKKVFQDATVETTIFVLQREDTQRKRDNNKIIVESLDEERNVEFIKEFKQSKIKKNHLYNFELYTMNKASSILEEIREKSIDLGDLVVFLYGLKTADDKKFIFNEQKNDECKRLLRSKDVGRYSKIHSGEYVWYVPNLMRKNKKTARPADKERFESDKIIVARMGKNVVATYDDEKYYVKDAMLLLRKTEDTNLKYLTGVLNSKLINYYYKNFFITIDVLKNALLSLPIKFGTEMLQEKITDKVDKMLSLNKRLNEFGDKITDERARIEKEIEKIDHQIDELVYKVYGITEKEQKIIEGKN